MRAPNQTDLNVTRTGALKRLNTRNARNRNHWGNGDIFTTHLIILLSRCGYLNLSTTTTTTV